MLKAFMVIFALLFGASLISCSKFKGAKHGSNGPPTASAPPDPAAFLKNQGAFCTVESMGVPANPIDRFKEVFVFGRDNQLRVMGFDLDSELRVQFNSKGEPKLHEIEAAAYRVEGEKLMIKSDAAQPEREAVFKQLSLEIDGKKAVCMELLPGASSTIHCGCTLPEKD